MIGVTIWPISFDASLILECKDLNDWLKNGIWKVWDDVNEEWAKKAYEEVMTKYGSKSKPIAEKQEPKKEK